MGRSKGYVVSQEMKLKSFLTRKAKKEGTNRIDPVYENQILYVSGKEKNGFDYWEEIREVLRPIHQYQLCRKVEKEIIDPAIWENIKVIKEVLEKYFTLVKGKRKKTIVIEKRKMNISDEERERRSKQGKINAQNRKAKNEKSMAMH